MSVKKWPRERYTTTMYFTGFNRSSMSRYFLPDISCRLRAADLLRSTRKMFRGDGTIGSLPKPLRKFHLTRQLPRRSLALRHVSFQARKAMLRGISHQKGLRERKKHGCIRRNLKLGVSLLVKRGPCISLARRALRLMYGRPVTTLEPVDIRLSLLVPHQTRGWLLWFRTQDVRVSR
jgi:hypothetical protein